MLFTFKQLVSVWVPILEKSKDITTLTTKCDVSFYFPSTTIDHTTQMYTQFLKEINTAVSSITFFLRPSAPNETIFIKPLRTFSPCRIILTHSDNRNTSFKPQTDVRSKFKLLLRCPALFYSFIYMSWFQSFLTLN